MKKTLMRTKKALQLKGTFMRYLTLKKIMNYLKYENDLRKKKIITSSFPPVITFQPSAYCNTNCQLCPVGLGIEGPKKGFLEFKKFQKIINEAKDYLIQIAFADWGEPFLNPAIFDMIKYAEGERILTHASTNLHLFKTEKEFEELLNSGLSFLTISLHGVSQKTYEAYQPGKIFTETADKIKTLINLKRKMRKNKPSIDLAFSITKKNQHEIENMQRFAETLGVDKDIYTASLNLRFYLHDNSKTIEMVKEWGQDREIDLCDISALDKERINELYEAILNEKEPSFNDLDGFRLTARHFCLDPWKTLVVNWDGTVSLCCVDYNKYVMGNTMNEAIIEIWNNEKYRNVRKYLLRKFDDKRVNFPCKKCVKY
jgi:radical SAM protein with 4Fe4S-binding SPASM domain